ncbi:MAG: glycosyltransferase family 39 protein [candidate division Zixibacteria bacterium]|nr:glycosyltransferase family 39 protein [candidate division Zixibacteria bacterium]
MKSKLLSSQNLILGFLILIAAGFIIAETVAYDITWDDSLIFYRYAENFVNGHGLVYNPGEFVEGYSSFLWTLLLALGGFIGFEISVVARWLGVLLAIGSVIIVFNLGRRFMPHTILAGVIAVLLLAFRFDFGLYAHSGMETALATFLVSLTYFLYIKKIDINRTLWTVGIIAGLISLTRPEGIIVMAAFTVTELTRYKSEKY